MGMDWAPAAAANPVTVGELPPTYGQRVPSDVLGFIGQLKKDNEIL